MTNAVLGVTIVNAKLVVVEMVGSFVWRHAGVEWLVGGCQKPPVACLNHAGPSVSCGHVLRHLGLKCNLRSKRQRALLIDKQPVTSYKEGQRLIQMTFSGLYIYYSVIFKFKENIIKALKI